MTSVSLSLACNDYEWLEPIIDGRIVPDGVDLTVLTDLKGGERHRRMLAGEFDIAEFSLGTYLTGWPDEEITAIPAFPRRFFPHSRTFVRRDSDITEPKDLEGNRVLVWTYQNTLALWARGIYAEHYGLNLDQVDWRVLRSEPLTVTASQGHKPIEADSKPVTLLEQGDVDAVISPYTQPLYASTEVRKLFKSLKSAESKYYNETGCYPPMHTVVIRDNILDKHPWLPTELLKSFRQSVDIFEERAQYESKYPLVWWQHYREQEREQFGDIWGQSFDLDSNIDELRMLVRYAEEQGILPERFNVDKMFVGTNHY